jgi:hypothetical protein
MRETFSGMPSVQIRNDTSNISTGRNEDDALDGFNVRAARYETRFSIEVCW